MHCTIHISLSSRVLALLVCLVGASMGGCSLLGGSPQLNHAENYAVTAPEGWKRISREQSDHAYELPSKSIVTVVSSCDHRSTAPLEVLSNHLLIGSRNRKIFKREEQTLGSQKGFWTQGRVEVEKTPVGLAFFVTKVDSCVFDFSLMKRNEVPEEDIQKFRNFITTFEYGKD